MKKDYQLVLGSPSDYHEITISVRINGEEICILQKEEGPKKVRIEFFDEPIETEIYYDVFIKAIKEAKEELLK